MKFFNETEFKKELTFEEQNKYLELAQLGDEKAKEKLLEHNLRLVTYIINRYYKDLDEELKKELFSVGCLELWKIIQKFNIAYKNEFSTYAVPSIYGSMKNFIRDNNTVYIPKKIKELAYKVRNIENEYSKKGNEEQLSINNLSKILGESKKNIILANNANQATQPLYWFNDKQQTMEEMVSDQVFFVYENLEQNEMYNDLIKSLNKLSEKQRITLILLFGLDGTYRTQKEVSELLNISQSRVSKLKKTALKNLQELIPQYIRDEYQQKKYIIKK